MNSLLDIRKGNLPGYPRTIYEAENIRIEVWKFNKISLLTLQIPRALLTEDNPGVAEWEINGIEHLVVSLPPEIPADVRSALNGQRFHAEIEDDKVLTDDFLLVYLGITLTDSIGSLFDEHGVKYDEAQYKRFKEEWGSELDLYMEP